MLVRGRHLAAVKQAAETASLKLRVAADRLDDALTALPPDAEDARREIKRCREALRGADIVLTAAVNGNDPSFFAKAGSVCVAALTLASSTVTLVDHFNRPSATAIATACVEARTSMENLDGTAAAAYQAVVDEAANTIDSAREILDNRSRHLRSGAYLGPLFAGGPPSEMEVLQREVGELIELAEERPGEERTLAELLDVRGALDDIAAAEGYLTAARWARDGYAATYSEVQRGRGADEAFSFFMGT